MKKYAKINGLPRNESNPDTNGAIAPVQPNAKFQGQLKLLAEHSIAGLPQRIADASQSSGKLVTRKLTVEKRRPQGGSGPFGH